MILSLFTLLTAKFLTVTDEYRRLTGVEGTCYINDCQQKPRTLIPLDEWEWWGVKGQTETPKGNVDKKKSL